MVRKFLFTIIMSLMFVNLLAQTGNLQGKIKDSKESLIGATVMINTTTATVSDIDGNFILKNIKPGTYSVKVSYISYNTQTINDVKIKENETTALNVVLESSTVNLNDVVVTAIKKTNNEAFTISNIKNSSSIVTGVSAQLISKSQDKDASEVVKRLPGVSIVDDKFIIIRGLSSRYNNVWINNSTAPSSDPDTRSFSFDVIPSSIIENIYILKSPTADLPSDYSGGFIKINTIGIPTQNSVNISYGTNYNQYTTFSDFYKQVPNEWNAKKTVGLPEQKMSVTINRKFDKGKFTMGNTTMIGYSYSDDHNEIINNNYSIYDFKNDKPSFNDEFIDNQYKSTNKLSLLHNWTIYPIDNLKIDFKNFANLISQSSSSYRTGREWYSDGRYIKATELTSSDRFMYTGQLGVEKKFDKSILDFTGGYSLTTKKDPDIRRYRYMSDDNNNYIILFSNNPDLSSLSRMKLNLNENIFTVGLNYTHNIKSLELKTGLFFENKQRSFAARNFGYTIPTNSDIRYTSLPIEEVFATGQLELEEITAPSDSYTATGQILAGYINGKLNLDKFNISGGLRIEKDIQTLDSYRQGTTIPVNVRRDTINLFPSANIAYHINDKNIIRSTYGLSINRPEFREIAPFYFVDFDLNAGIYGNENIKAAYVHNFDLRYELYPKSDETFNIGVFYKKFINPIEVVILGNNPTQYSFDNIPEAHTYGVEVEARKSLDFMKLDKFSVVGNLSLIRSSMSFDRPLQGQSPYIVNLGLYYTEEKTSASLSYNLIGKRIVAVGRPSPNKWESIPDIYEMPRNEMNFLVSRKLSKHIEIKAGVKDIFNENIKYQQDINTPVDMSIYGSEGIKQFNRNQITRLYHPGRQFILNLSYKF